MMRIGKNYNLILQEIYRSYPNTVNKNIGSYIKIQPASAEDHENIKNLLDVKKADHYVIEHPTVLKAVIKGLPASTDIADIESELKMKGMAVEKIAQLRRFATKAPLPIGGASAEGLRKAWQRSLRTLGISLADGATVSLRDRSLEDSCHLTGQAASLPLAEEKATTLTFALIETLYYRL
ncbi:UNVERIFIED_CONTAM: hypothetical protein NCL1_47460 [Trichonephila clavipes]